MRVKPKPDAVARRLVRLAANAARVRIAAAAYDPLFTGGFERLLAKRQGVWPALHPDYERAKARAGYDPRVWVRTGRTLRAMSQGPLPRKAGSKGGIRFQITRKGTLASVRPQVFQGGRRKPPVAVQQKIWKNLNYGIDAAGKAKAIKDKRGRLLNGRPARPMVRGWFDGMEKQIEEALELELAKIAREERLNPGGRR